MKTLTAVILLAATVVFATDALAAAGESTGSIAGRVRNIATGQYLNRARVAVRGTEHVVFSDEYGAFRIADLRSGEVTLDVFYTDLDPQAVKVNVPAGGVVERDIDLTSVARYGGAPAGAVVRLDPVTVASQKETDAQAIATNEQRFAPNIKNVIATDAFGEVFNNSAGDFLKFLPGLSADYDNAEVSTISVRGMGGDKTAVLFDGAPIVTGANAGPTRAVEMRTQALNNVARIDVTKVPTPATPADTLAGSINLISKNAFERSGAEFRFGVNLGATNNTLRLGRTPTSYKDERIYKIKPGFDFDYTQPIGKNFGFVLTGVFNQKFNEQNISRKTWANSVTGGTASIANPFLQQFLIQDSPRYTNRSVYSLKADWRVTPNSVLTFGTRHGKNTRASTGHTTATPSAGTNATSAIAGGTNLAYGPDFTIGATGRGALTVTGGWQYSVDYTSSTSLGYRYDDGKWRLEANTSFSHSETLLPSTSRGHFNNVTAVNRVPVRKSGSYRVIIVDCPPALGMLSMNSLAAADFLLIALQCEYLALEGLGQILRNVERLKTAHINDALELGGVVMTMFDLRTKLSRQVVDEVKQHLPDKIFQTVIPRTVRLSEAPSFGKTIFEYDQLNPGSTAYRNLAKEVIERFGLKN